DVPRLEEVVTSMAEGTDRGVRRQVGRCRHRLKDNRVRDVDIVSHSLAFAGRRALLVVAIDVTETKQTQETLAKYTERLSILHEIDRTVIAARPPVEVAEAVLRRIRDLLGVPRAIVNLFDFSAGEADSSHPSRSASRRKRPASWPSRSRRRDSTSGSSSKRRNSNSGCRSERAS